MIRLLYIEMGYQADLFLFSVLEKENGDNFKLLFMLTISKVQIIRNKLGKLAKISNRI